jgi:hypothetical protein
MIQGLGHQPDQDVVVDGAGGHEQHGAGAVMVPPPGGQGFGFGRGHGLGPAGDGMGDIGIVPGGGPEILVDLVLGRLLDHGDFLQDHGLFTLELPGVQGRMQGDVGQDGESPGKMGVHDPDMKAGDLPGGVGIGQAAQGVEFLGNGLCGPGGGPLEGHVFPQMGHAFLPGRLVTGAGLDPDAEACGLGLGQVFGGDPGAVRQACYAAKVLGKSVWTHGGG